MPAHQKKNYTHANAASQQHMRHIQFGVKLFFIDKTYRESWGASIKKV